VPQATSYEFPRHLNGPREYARMIKSVPLALAVWRSVPKTFFFVVFWFVTLIAFFMPVLKLVILWILSGLFGVVRLIYGHAQRPPIEGSASSNMMSGRTFPSTTALTVTPADSLHYMSVCDLTFPMCVWSCFVSLALRSR
jgi:hypothetical protein